MINYTRQLKTSNWNEYGKRTGLGKLVNSFEITDAEGKLDPMGRVLVLFEKNNTETYVLFDGFSLLAESKESDELVKLASDPNETLIVRDRDIKHHANEYVKYMVQNNDEEYKQASYTHHNCLRSSYQQRYDTVSKKRTNYCRILASIDKGSTPSNKYSRINCLGKIQRYTTSLTELKEIIKYEQNLTKLIEKTSPISERQ